MDERWEVCLQYPTYLVWKYENQVTLAEARQHKIVERRLGNSETGYIIDTNPAQVINPQPDFIS